MQILKDKNLTQQIPVVLITGDKTEDVEAQCYKLGAADFVTKPFDIKVVRYIINNAITVYGEKTKWKKLGIIQNRKLQQQTEELKTANENIIEMLGTIVEYRGAVDRKHVQRVKEITTLLATAVGELYPEYKIDEEVARKIGLASCLHDIGKNIIPDKILFKPGILTKEETDVMKSHTTKGCEMLRDTLKFQSAEYQQYCTEICRSHHERYDGRGYPDGLVGETIPISAQIVSVAECFDALISDTVYRKAIKFDTAFTMIINGDCGVFSPKVIECFKENRQKLYDIANTYAEV